MKILIIEDNKSLVEALTELLKNEGYLVDYSFDGLSGLDNALTGLYDVIILDYMIPKMNGISLLKELRKENVSTPVLMLTAKSQIDDKVEALDYGADDYLTKPFETKELFARIRALSRRKENFVNDKNSFKGLSIDMSNLTISYENKKISLSLKEANLLEMLLLKKGKLVLKENIIEKIWGLDSNAEDNHVEVYISFLRKKLANIGSTIKISTVRGFGYCLKEDINA